jgi:hypothetical protein
VAVTARRHVDFVEPAPAVKDIHPEYKRLARHL